MDVTYRYETLISLKKNTTPLALKHTKAMTCILNCGEHDLYDNLKRKNKCRLLVVLREKNTGTVLHCT